MDHEPSRTSPLAPDRAHWTPAKQRIFLAALLECGSVARAARAAGMSGSSAHRLRGRLAGTAFDRAWSQAQRLHAARLADPFETDSAAASPPPARPAPVARPAPR